MTDEPTPSEPDSSPDSPSDELLPTRTEIQEPAKRRSQTRGFLDILLLVILAGLIGASYMLYDMQQKQREEIATQLEKIEAGLSAVKQQVAQPRDNKTEQALKEELVQLRQQLQEGRHFQEQQIEELRQEFKRREPPLRSPERGQDAPPLKSPAQTDEEHPQQKPPPAKGVEDDYVDFVESTSAKLWRLLKEGVGSLIDQLGEWIKKI